jgi:nitroreductase
MSDNGQCGAKAPEGDSLLAGRGNFARFDSQPVPEECLRQILALASLSPTECYFRPWRWIVVRSQVGKQVVEAATMTATPLGTAPVVLICLADTTAWKTAPQQIQEMVAKKKLSPQRAQEVLRGIREQYASSPELAQRATLAHAFAALHQILIAVADCELSACWVSAFDEPKIKAHFHIPGQFLVAALLGIGHAERPLSPPPELPLQSLVYQEKFGQALDFKNTE